jgi:hypothetical protein
MPHITWFNPGQLSTENMSTKWELNFFLFIPYSYSHPVNKTCYRRKKGDTPCPNYSNFWPMACSLPGCLPTALSRQWPTHAILAPLVIVSNVTAESKRIPDSHNVPFWTSQKGAFFLRLGRFWWVQKFSRFFHKIE